MWTDNFLLKRSMETSGEVRQFLLFDWPSLFAAWTSKPVKKYSDKTAWKGEKIKL